MINKNKKATIVNKERKRPISILLCTFLGVLFLLFLFIGIFAMEDPISNVLYCFVFFLPVIFLICLTLIFVNIRNGEKKRFKYFGISTTVIGLLIVLAIVGIFLTYNPYDMANSYFEDKKYELAIDEYQKVIDSGEDQVEIEKSRDQIKEAEQFILEAQEYLANGNSYFNNNLFEIALSEYEKAFKIYPYLSGLKQRMSETQNQIDNLKEEKTEMVEVDNKDSELGSVAETEKVEPEEIKESDDKSGKSEQVEEEVEETVIETKEEQEDPKIQEEIIEVSLKIAVWNLTEENGPDLEIWIRGTGSWYPDKEAMEFGGDFFVPVEPFSSEKVNEIYIYPDGRGGSEILVEITVTDDMVSESDKDTINIEIYDKTVEVWGTAIDGFDQKFKR